MHVFLNFKNVLIFTLSERQTDLEIQLKGELHSVTLQMPATAKAWATTKLGFGTQSQYSAWLTGTQVL